jgi:hypothetical protein
MPVSSFFEINFADWIIDLELLISDSFSPASFVVYFSFCPAAKI